jgi:tripartite-type tricarboxylate transporter receptor subunit TctC
MKKMVMAFLLISFFLSPVCLKPIELWAAPTPYYDGKVLTIIVGHAPGGGYDRMSRLLAKYLPKYIPGKPSVVIKQMTGGGTVIAANYVYNQAKPDGLTITALDRGMGTRQLAGLEGIKYDFIKYAWIGNVASEPTGLFLTTTLPYKTFDNLLKAKDKKLFIGASGFGNYTATLPLILRDYLGIKIEIVTYPEATATIMLAIERGEVHGHYSAFSTYLPLIQRGVVRPLLRGKAAPGGEFDKLPVIDDIVSDKTAKGIIKIFSAVEVAARPYVAPPGTPENIMKILREAFANVSKDKDLLAEIEKQKMEYGFMTAEESLKIVRGYMSSPPEVIKAFQKYESEK